MVRYQNKCKLIKNWDLINNKLDEDQQNLQSMKLSIYFKAFEEELSPLDEKLQKIKNVLDEWIQVQKKWVYLESIFFGQSDIKQQLVNEYNRFKMIDSEFTTLMKKVANKPLLMEVISIPGLLKTLERLRDYLVNIQKSLVEYLERQRSEFARFYFVGDEDLLEIIGNSKEVAVVQRHLPKMYAGIQLLSLETNANNQSEIVGMTSREAESVPFVKRISIAEDPKINVWLGKVSDCMKAALGAQLELALKELPRVSSTPAQILGLFDKHPFQMLLIALQIQWTSNVEQGLVSKTLDGVVDKVTEFLNLLAETILSSLSGSLRIKYENTITELVHERDVTRSLSKS